MDCFWTTSLDEVYYDALEYQQNNFSLHFCPRNSSFQLVSEPSSQFIVLSISRKYFPAIFFSIFMNMHLWMGLFYGYLVYLILKVLGMTNLQYEICMYRNIWVPEIFAKNFIMKSQWQCQCCHSFFESDVISSLQLVQNLYS